MEKKAHLLRVGKDSAGSHKGQETKFLGEDPQTPIRPSLLLSWVSSDRPPSLI